MRKNKETPAELLRGRFLFAGKRGRAAQRQAGEKYEDNLNVLDISKSCNMGDEVEGKKL